MFAGILLGVAMRPANLGPQGLDLLGFPGDIMLRLLKMMVLPLIAGSMIAGESWFWVLQVVFRVSLILHTVLGQPHVWTEVQSAPTGWICWALPGTSWSACSRSCLCIRGFTLGTGGCCLQGNVQDVADMAKYTELYNAGPTVFLGSFSSDGSARH